jgi:histidinol-phosphate/aromatic aminotransferase/cobyric acid decarboxylase-like protein
MLDFCYLVNPYYPPKKLLEEIQASFTQLITNYPSGQRINSLVAAKNFGLNENYLVVGNGAAELINIAMNILKGTIGIIRPSFEEYANRCEMNNIVDFTALQYNANDLIHFFNDKQIKTLVLVNPDNPSGNFIEKDGLLSIFKWSKQENINIIIDESFADFAETEEPITLLKQNLLDEYKNLIIIKSISKSYGVPGLRLGVLASGNKEFIEKVKTYISVWNINSFAEFYLQIYEKYANDYNVALQKFYCERKRFASELAKNNKLKVYPSQANYFMIELLDDLKARKLCEKLLNEKHILIKDLSNKNGINGEFVRIAIKTEEENNELIKAINKCII